MRRASDRRIALGPCGIELPPDGVAIAAADRGA
jgi:hypothetical protein